MKAQEVRDFLAVGAARITELNAKIHRTFALRSQSDADWKEWKDACALFHGSYDELAFPGGLEKAMNSLKAGDTKLAEAALIYCEIRPYYFRSGYHRSKFLRLLGHVSLPTHLETRLKAVKDDVHRRKLESRRQYSEYWHRRVSEVRAQKQTE